MEEIKHLLNIVVEDSLTPAERGFIEDNKHDSKAVEDMMKVKYYHLDKELRVNALKEVLKKKYINYYKTLIETENVEELLPTLKKIKEMENASEESVKNSDYLFITFAPPENEISIDNMIKKLTELCKFKYITQSLFVIEQRYNGIPNEKYAKPGDGLHYHLLINKGKHKLSDVKRDIKRKFGTYQINMDYKFIKDVDLLKVQTYMIGKKKDVDKQQKQEQDAIFRKKNGLKDYYGELFL